MVCVCGPIQVLVEHSNHLYLKGSIISTLSSPMHTGVGGSLLKLLPVTGYSVVAEIRHTYSLNKVGDITVRWRQYGLHA